MHSLDPTEDLAIRLLRRFLLLCEHPRTRQRMLRMVRQSTRLGPGAPRIYGWINRAVLNPRFQPLVGSWKAGLPSDVNFIYVPAMFGGYWDDYARGFYAAEALGVQEKTHDALYAAIHLEQTLNGERSPNDKPQDIANFYAKHGVDATTFLTTMGSFAVLASCFFASSSTGTPWVHILMGTPPSGCSWL